MKDDPIFRLVKESKLETSSSFAEAAMEAIESRSEKRMKIKVYLLVSAIVVLLVLTVLFLISSGFKVVAFGFTISFPRIATILAINLLSYCSILHLIGLFKTGLSKLEIT